jgi:hypothetical protein
MTTLDASAENQRQAAQAQRALLETLAEITRRGFFGSAAVEMNVQNGTIQYIRRKIDRMEK